MLSDTERRERYDSELHQFHDFGEALAENARRDAGESIDFPQHDGWNPFTANTDRQGAKGTHRLGWWVIGWLAGWVFVVWLHGFLGGYRAGRRPAGRFGGARTDQTKGGAIRAWRLGGQLGCCHGGFCTSLSWLHTLFWHSGCVVIHHFGMASTVPSSLSPVATATPLMAGRVHALGASMPALTGASPLRWAAGAF